VEPDCSGRCMEALEARHGVHFGEELREVAAGIVRRLVVVDDLAEQLHFLAPRSHGLVHVGEDVGLGPHALVPAGRRHDAEGAVIVAPLDDGDVGPDRIAAARHADGERDVVEPRHVHCPARAAVRCHRPLDERRQLLQPVRTEHDVDQAAIRLLEERVALLLRHAPRHRDHARAAGVFAEYAQLAEARIELLLGVLSHATGIDHDHVRVAVVGRRLIAGLIEQPRHPLRIVDVHLTSERLDEISLRHRPKP
jgi:hypothetical protein